ncbi:ribonuclease family protein [Mycobacteroides abscessus]|nr:ribonuclease family protein [Mycobacteroides abscessus]
MDLILPDIRHIEDRLEDVEALVLTHAHGGPHRGHSVPA